MDRGVARLGGVWGDGRRGGLGRRRHRGIDGTRGFWYVRACPRSGSDVWMGIRIRGRCGDGV
jgi:hypothetical protein